MQIKNLGKFNNIDDFVADKLKRLESMPQNFNSIMELMFSEKSNIMFERSDGYKINKVTYGQCYEKSIAYSKILKNRIKAPEQSVVGIYMANSPEWIEMFWAVLLSGYNPLLLNMRLDDASLNKVLQQLNVKAVISDEKKLDSEIIYINDIKTEENEGITPVDENISDIHMGQEIMLMSSGTSANVKVCAYTAGEFASLISDSYNIIKNCALIKKHYDGELKLLTFLPFYHIFGFVAMYLWFGFFSRTFVLLKDFGADTIVNTIRKHKVTHIFAVPLLWDKVYSQALQTIKNRGEQTYAKFQKGMKLAQKPVIGKLITKYALKEIRDNLFGESICFMISGGGAISSEVLTFFNSIGYHLVNGYGMTEIGITSVELSSSKKEVCKGAIGAPLSSVEYKINEDGELLVRGKSLASRIWDGEKYISIKDGWFNTKDLVELRDGKYYILGRKDDLIISSSGENLNPNLIEDKFAFESVQDVCLVATEKSGKQNIVLLVSVPRFLSREKIKAINEKCLAKLQELKLAGEVSKVVFVTESLLGENDFKVNRKKIRKAYEAGSLAVFDLDSGSELNKTIDINALGELEKQVALNFATALGKDVSEISMTGDFFFDYGGTSLDYFALISKLQQEFNIPFPANESVSFSTVKSLCEFIQEAL